MFRFNSILILNNIKLSSIVADFRKNLENTNRKPWLTIPRSIRWIPIQIRTQGFSDQKFTAVKNWYFFLSKIVIYLSVGLHKGCPSYSRSLQPSIENISKFLNFFLFLWLIFALLDPDTDPLTLLNPVQSNQNIIFSLSSLSVVPVGGRLH